LPLIPFTPVGKVTKNKGSQEERGGQQQSYLEMDMTKEDKMTEKEKE
jgi:hypothetical protein